MRGSKQEVSALCHLKESFELIPIATLDDEVEEAADHFGSGVNQKFCMVADQVVSKFRLLESQSLGQ